MLDAGLHFAGLFNEKARLWSHGRRGIFRRMAEAVQQSDIDRKSATPDAAQGDLQGKLSKQTSEAIEQVAGTESGGSDSSAERQLIWFHCASLGEFEQGRPVIEAFRAAHPDWKILLTFFSPSGYEVRKSYTGADFIFYLPADTPRNVRRFMAIFRPKIAVFVKYRRAGNQGFFSRFKLLLQGDRAFGIGDDERARLRDQLVLYQIGHVSSQHLFFF